jgi:hypothetical protein
MLKMSQSAGSGTSFSVSSSEAQVSKCRIQAEDGQAGQYAARCAGRPPYYDPTGGSRGKQRGTVQGSAGRGTLAPQGLGIGGGTRLDDDPSVIGPAAWALSSLGTSENQ